MDCVGKGSSTKMHWHMVTTLLLAAVPLLPVTESVLPPHPAPPPPFSALAAGTCGCWATVAPFLRSTKATAVPEAACMTPPTLLTLETWPPFAKATAPS